MGYKHPKKITHKFMSLLAASAMITTQIPVNLSVNAANTDNGLKTLINSIDASSNTNVTSEKVMDTNNAISTSIVPPQTTTKTASSTSTAQTINTATNYTASSNISNTKNIQPDPTLSCSRTVIPASKAGSVVPVSIFINDSNFKNEEYYENATVIVDFDGRLNLSGVKSGTEDGSAGMTASYTSYGSNYYRKTYGIYVSKSSNNGKNGTYATMNITIPANAKPGDIYYFNICTNNSQRHYFNYTNPQVKNNYDHYKYNTANTDDDKYLKGTPLDGYILIDPDSQPSSSTATSDHEVVMKDLVYYNVYDDHAEVAYCDYEAEKAEIASEINGQKVTSIAPYAFAYTKVRSVVIPDTVTSIGSYSFSYASLESVDIPDSVENIGYNAFTNNSALKSVKLSSNLKNIQSYTFSSCSSLVSLTIPESVETIGENTFYNCQSLKELSLPNKLTAIPYGMCSGCSSLSKINIPKNLKSIGGSAFYNTALESIELSDTVTTIADSAFNNCKKLSSVKLPSNLTTIQRTVFSGCSSLESIELPDSIITIGPSAFSNSGLKKINYPEALKNIQDSAFSGTKFETVEYPADSVICGTNIFQNCSKIKQVTFPEGLKKISNYAFNGCTSLEKVTLPDSVTTIGSYAFSDSGVTEINIPKSMTTLSSYSLAGTKITSFKLTDNITELGDGVFENCSKLASIDLGNTIKTIPQKAFYNCKELKNIDLPDSITNISNKAFAFSGMTEIKMPDSVTSLNTDTFTDSNIESIIYSDDRTSLPICAYGGASKLKEVKLPSKLTALPKQLFAGCSSIKNIEIPSSVTTINSYAFQNSSIVELKVPANVQTMKEYAFSNSKLESVEFDDEIKNLPTYAFSYSTNLKSVKLPANLTSIPKNAFNYCSSLTEISIPDSVTTIGEYAFSGCKNISSLDIPDALVYIGSSAFYDTAIKEIKLPETIKTVQYAFNGSNIETITYPDSLTALPAYAYSGAAKMTTVKLPSNLEALPDYCFNNCTGLNEFVIPESIKTIGSRVFNNCGVKTLKVPATVEQLNNYAFAMSNLESVELDEKFTELPDYLFNNCSKLSSVKLSSNLKTIPSNTFNGCKALETISLPSALETIGNNAFSASGLRSVEIPDTVTVIGNSSFSGATNLTSVKLSSSLKSIADSAFYNCTSLTDVSIPEGIENIDNYAFYYCTSLANIKLPSTVKSLGSQTFGSCSKLSSIKLPDALEIIKSSAFAKTGIKSLIIPDSVNSLQNSFFDSNIETITYSDSRTELPEYAYSGAAKMTSVNLPSKLTAIPAYAFDHCTALSSLEIPETVKSIGSYAFNYCGVKELKLPDGVETLAANAFSNSKLESVELSDSITAIGNSSFYNANSLKTIKLPSNLETIGSQSFYGCSLLTDIKLPETLKTIDKYAFNNCRALKSIELPDSVTSIGNSAFSGSGISSIKLPAGIEELTSGCLAGTLIESFEIPSSVKIIGDSAFNNSSKLKSIKLPSGIESIGTSAFNNCPLLSDVKLPDTLKTIGTYAFSNTSSVTELEIPASVTKIDSNAFSGSGLKSIIIPDTVENISTSSLFSNCKSLESVVLPDSSTAISGNCFYNCTSLKSVELSEKTKSIDNNAFYNCTSLTSLYIPINVTTISTNAFRSCKLNTIIGYKDSFAEKYAENNNLKFIEADVKTWDKKDSLPSAGVYKLDCDVTVEGEVNISYALDLDLNGHKVTVGKFVVEGAVERPMTIRDSSKEKTGYVCTSAENELFLVKTRLILLGGTFVGNELENNSATIIVNTNNTSNSDGKAHFILDGATVISHYGSALDFGSRGTANLISGTLDTASKNSKGDSSDQAAVNIPKSSYGKVTLSGATVKAGKGHGIYSVSSNGGINISGGKITSSENYGIYCDNSAAVNLSGKLDITGNEADIRISGGKSICITDKLTGGNVRVESAKAGIITQKYAQFHKDTDASEFFTAVKGAYLTLDKSSSEIVYNTTTTTKTTTTIKSKPTTTTTTTTSKSTTTTNKTTTSSTSKITTSTKKPVSTSTSATAASTTSTTTTQNLNHPNLNVAGELTFKPMTKQEIIDAGIDLSDPANFNCVKYTIQLEFGVNKPAAINRIVNENGRTVDNQLDIDGYEPVFLKDDDFTWVEGLGAHVMHTETVDEEMYLIIYGECKWLKEFYDVQLMIVNKGDGTLKNCSSTLTFPNGLTLAKGDKTQDMGELAPGEVKTTHWYLRGDKEGDYALSASFKGDNSGEPFELTFKSKENLHVYSSKALHMTIELPMYSYYKKDYPIKITLKNVSDKPIYDLENRILGVKQGSKATLTYRDLDEEGNVISESSVTKEKVIYEKQGGPSVSIEELAPGKELTLEFSVPDLWKSVYEQYLSAEKFDELTKMVLSMVKNDPNVLDVDIIRAVYASALDEMPVEHILKKVSVGFIDSDPIPYTVIVTPEKSTQNVPAKRIMTPSANNLLGDIFNTAYSDSETDTDKSRFEIFRNNFICNVDMTDPDEVSTAFNNYLSEFDNNVWDMTEDMNLVIHPHNGKAANVKIVPEVRRGAPSETGSGTSITNNAFAITDIDGKKVDSNGVLTVKNDTVVRISADQIGASGTLVIDYADGTTETHKICNTEEHECRSTGGYTMAVAPKNGQNGLAIKTCDTCGKIVESIYIHKNAVAMLSDGRTFADVHVAVEEAVKSGEATELSLFGNITIASDLNIPDYINIAIVPESNIKVSNNAKIVAKGDINDFSGHNYNLSGNVPITTTVTTTTAKTTTTSTTSTTTAPVTVRYGDVNGDKIVDSVDASLVLRHYALYSTNNDSDFTKEQETAADVNKDAHVDASDASLILKYYAYCSTIDKPESIEDYLNINKTTTTTTTKITATTTTKLTTTKPITTTTNSKPTTTKPITTTTTYKPTTTKPITTTTTSKPTTTTTEPITTTTVVSALSN